MRTGSANLLPGAYGQKPKRAGGTPFVPQGKPAYLRNGSFCENWMRASGRLVMQQRYVNCCVQANLSKIPAAPMPPPTHMVTIP